jgi:transcriptional regulator with XRE-family HTH domain
MSPRTTQSLRQWLTRTRTTQSGLAEQLGVVPSYVSMILSRQREPSLAVAVRLSQLTGIAIRTFVLSTPPPTRHHTRSHRS